MHRYAQRSGLWSHGATVYAGYSGHGEGKNDPLMQAAPRVGPIPQGRYLIVGPPVNTQTHGPFVLALRPEPGTQTFGRHSFLLHGDSIQRPGTASEGCIILPNEARRAIWNSLDRELEVVSGDEPVQITT